MHEQGARSAMRWAGGLLAVAGLAALVAGERGWSALVPAASIALGACLVFSRPSAAGDRGGNDERFRIVARVTNDAIWDWDLATDAIEWNEGIHTLFGYAVDEVTPTSEFWSSRIHTDDRQRVLEGLATLHASHQDAWQEEYRFRRRGGD